MEIRKLRVYINIISAILIAIGFIFLASISQPISQSVKKYPFYLVFKQILIYAITMVFCALFYPLYKSVLNSNRLRENFIYISMALIIIALVITLFMPSVNGATRWISLGIIKLQTSEIIKPFLIIILAVLASNSIFSNIKSIEAKFSFVFLALTLILLYLQKANTSTAQIAILIFLMICLDEKMKEVIKFLCALIGILLGALGLLIKGYSKNRIGTFNPFNPSATQVIASVDAVKLGGLMGVGFGNGQQKYFYLSEAHTDYIFSSIAEEGGLLISLIILFLFILLIFFMYKLALSINNSENRIVILGITFNIANQFLLHLLINLNLFPSTGVTLPFISYGGSSFIANCMCLLMINCIVNKEIKGSR